MGKYKKLGKNVALITVGSFTSKLLTFFLIPLYTAVLSTSDYGIADLMTTTVNLVYPFFSLLMTEALTRFALDCNADKKQVFSVGLYTTLLGFLVMLIFSPIILLSNSLKSYYIFFIFYYLCYIVHLIFAHFVRGIEKIAIYSIGGIVQTFSAILLNLVFLLKFNMGVRGYLMALITASVISSIFLWIGAGLKKYVIPIRKIDKNVVSEMWKYSIPMIPNSISWWVSNSSDKFMLTFFIGVSATGIYSVSQKIPTIVSTISSIFISAWQISAVEDFGTEQSQRFYSDVYRKFSSLNFILISTLICGVRILAQILFAKEFYQGWMYVPVLLMAYYFNTLSTFLGSIYTSAKKTKMLFISTLLAAVVNITLNFVLIPVWGTMGAAIATLVSYFVVWVVRLINTRGIVKIDFDKWGNAISFLIIVIQSILMLMNNIPMFCVSIVLSIVLIVVNRSIIGDIFAIVKKRFIKGKQK